MNYNDQIHNIMILFFEWCRSNRYVRILLTPVKYVYANNGDTAHAMYVT